MLTWGPARDDQPNLERQPRLFPRLRTVAITTNGLLTWKTLKAVAHVVERLREQEIDLVLIYGMHAVGGNTKDQGS